jgi:hypothetical protein
MLTLDTGLLYITYTETVAAHVQRWKLKLYKKITMWYYLKTHYISSWRSNYNGLAIALGQALSLRGQSLTHSSENLSARIQVYSSSNLVPLVYYLLFPYIEFLKGNIESSILHV